ncbi:MAG: hypothetical protein AAF693_06525 [Bacteroidota bacterium]
METNQKRNEFLRTKTNMTSGIIGLAAGILITFSIFQITRPGSDTVNPGSNTTDEKCLTFREEYIAPIPFERFQRDIARFKNMIADSVTKDLRNHLKGKNKRIEASVQCTFTLNRLKNFIHLIEDNVPENINKENLALTWNYAVYSKSMEDPDYGRLQTLYGVPAILVNGLPAPMNVHGVVYDELIQGKMDSLSKIYPSGAPVSLIDSTLNKLRILALTSSLAHNEPETRNHGQLCPPPPCEVSAKRLLEDSYDRNILADYSN